MRNTIPRRPKGKFMSALNEFLETSYTAYHAVKNAAEYLIANGFSLLSEGEDWNVEEGGKYFVTRGGSSLIAFSVGALDNGLAFRIAASHADSPALKLKDNAVFATGAYEKLNAECYGGGIWYSFFDRPLKIAGRIVESEKGVLRSRVVESDYFVTIPSVAVHQNRGVNEGFAVNAQTDLCPLYSLARQGGDLVSSFSSAPVAAYDLYLVNAQSPYVFGRNGEFLASPRVDNLTSVFASVEALTSVRAASGVCVAAIFDNEEVGSSTRQGADSSFLRDVLDRILNAIPHSAQAQAQAFANSFVLSADNAHAVHPNFADKADPCNKVILGKGVVVKVNASQKYTTSGLTGAAFTAICEKAGVPVQTSAARTTFLCRCLPTVPTCRAAARWATCKAIPCRFPW